MGFLPFPSDDEFSPEAAAAAAAFQAEHPGPISNLDRTLLGSARVFDAYLGWFAARDEVVPYLGERAVDLFALAISRAYGAPYPVAFYTAQLTASGDDPDAPHVTEAEALLLEWGAAIGVGIARPRRADGAHRRDVPAEAPPRAHGVRRAHGGGVRVHGRRDRSRRRLVRAAS